MPAPFDLEQAFNDATAEALGIPHDKFEGEPDDMTVEQQLVVLRAQVGAVHDATKAIASTLGVMFR